MLRFFALALSLTAVSAAEIPVRIGAAAGFVAVDLDAAGSGWVVSATGKETTIQPLLDFEVDRSITLDGFLADRAVSVSGDEGRPDVLVSGRDGEGEEAAWLWRISDGSDDATWTPAALPKRFSGRRLAVGGETWAALSSDAPWGVLIGEFPETNGQELALARAEEPLGIRLQQFIPDPGRRRELLVLYPDGVWSVALEGEEAEIRSGEARFYAPVDAFLTDGLLWVVEKYGQIQALRVGGEAPVRALDALTLGLPTDEVGPGPAGSLWLIEEGDEESELARVDFLERGVEVWRKKAEGRFVLASHGPLHLTRKGDWLTVARVESAEE